MLKYRPEIDGLRAIAVLAVILYHAGVPGLDGGFVGVDVFFVISGFLITSLLVGELSRGDYSVVGFYERRIRRIFPPLFAMLGATFVVAYFVLLPNELRALAKSLYEATLFHSNVGFWSQSGYFDAGAESKPLLHTWSLCVEEQFYFVFPLLLAACWRVSRRLVPWLCGALLVASLAWSAIKVAEQPDAAFYLAHLRAWELLIGSMVAMGVVPAPITPAAKTALSALGLGMIVYAVATFHPTMVFPGPAALVPTLGAAFIIHAEGSGLSWVGKGLGHRAPVAVGLVSYALYLWHWPVLVFGRMLTVRALNALEVACALAVTVVLAVLSRHLLEEPVRKRAVFKGRRAAFGVAAAAMACACLLAYPTMKRGLPKRVPSHVARLAKVPRNAAKAMKEVCLPGTIREPKGVSGLISCDVGDPAVTRKTFLVWGDSHAGSLAPAVDRAARELGLRGTIMARGGCAPAFGIRKVGLPAVCKVFNDYVKGQIERKRSYRKVILASRWGAWVEESQYTGPDRIALENRDETAYDAKNAARIFKGGLESTVRYLVKKKHKQVVIVGAVPETEYSVPATLARVRWLGLPFDMRQSTAEYRAKQAPFEGILRDLGQHFPFTVVKPHEALCKNGKCDVEHGGKPLYIDAHHLAASSATLLSPMFSRALSEPHGATSW